MKIINKIKKNLNLGKVTKNIGWILFQNIYTMLLSLVITGFVARRYGTVGYGTINFCLSFIALFSFIAIFGTNHIIIKDFTEDKYDDGVVLGSNLFIRIILSLITLIISQTICFFLYDKEVNIITLLFNINTILCSFDVISYYAQSKIRNKYISIAKIVSFTLFSISKLLVTIYNLNLYYLALTYLFETFIYILMLIWSYNKVKDQEQIKWSINFKYLKELLSKSKYYALSSLMVTIYMRIDQVMIGTFFSDKSYVGIYSAAVRISEIWTFVPLAVITSFKPIVIKSKEQKKEQEYHRNLQKLYNISSLISFIFVVGIIIFGKLGIYILYSKNFISAYIPLIILSIGTWIGVLGNIHYVWMTCENKEKYSMFYSLSGCVTNIIFNIILIPKYGISGAAIATLISEIFSNIIAFLFIKEARVLSKLLLKSLNPFYGLKNILKG